MEKGKKKKRVEKETIWEKISKSKTIVILIGIIIILTITLITSLPLIISSRYQTVTTTVTELTYSFIPSIIEKKELIETTIPIIQERTTAIMVPITITETKTETITKVETALIEKTFTYKREPEVEVNVFDIGGEWTTLTAGGEPIFYKHVALLIFNKGDEDVEVNVSVKLNDQAGAGSLKINARSYYFADDILACNYDKKYLLEVGAKYDDKFTSDTLQFDTIFPRQPLWISKDKEKFTKMYLWWKDPLVRGIAEKVGFPKWLGLNNWVAENIKYKHDEETHGVPEYFQFPEETIRLGTGDCEDFAILLASLYRAAGYSEDSVYVIIGYKEDGGHAWVKIRAEILGRVGTWVYIEPQEIGGLSIITGEINFMIYNEVFEFNDVIFRVLKSQ
jgi:hypothetical protein